MKKVEKVIFKPNFLLQSTISALQTPPKLRTNSDITNLILHTQSSEFFNRVNREYPALDLHRCLCTYMTLEEFSKSSPIYKLGDAPTSIYFVLSGSITISLPSKLLNILTIPREFQPIVKSLVKSIKDVNQSLQDPESVNIRRLFQDYLEKDLRIIEGVNECKNRDITENIGIGESFGYVGLFTERLRSHNATSTEKVTLAVLTKENFSKAIAAYNEKRINDRIDFLHKLPIFSAWSRLTICKLLDLFVPAVYSRNQRVFKEGDPATCVYFIMRGELKLTKAEVYSQRLIDTNEEEIGGFPLRYGKSRKIIKAKELQLVLKGVNQIIGIEDMGVGDQPRSYSCYGFASKTEVLIMNKSHFIEKVYRADNVVYINNKRTSEVTWLGERVHEIKETNLIGQTASNQAPHHPEKQKKTKPETAMLRFRFNRETDQRSSSAAPSQHFRKLSLTQKPLPTQAPLTPLSLESKRLPPANFLISLQKKRDSICKEKGVIWHSHRNST